MCRAFDCTVKVIRVWVLIFLTLTDVIKAAFLTVFPHLHTCPHSDVIWCERLFLSPHLDNFNTQLCNLSCFFFCLTQTYHKTHILHLFSANKEHFNKELTQNLQHLFQTCPLLSSTLFHRCTHTHTQTLCPIQPCTCVLMLYLMFLSTATAERFARHMTEPRDNFSAQIRALLPVCSVLYQSGQRPLELSTKLRICPMHQIPW